MKKEFSFYNRSLLKAKLGFHLKIFDVIKTIQVEILALLIRAKYNKKPYEMTSFA